MLLATAIQIMPTFTLCSHHLDKTLMLGLNPSELCLPTATLAKPPIQNGKSLARLRPILLIGVVAGQSLRT